MLIAFSLLLIQWLSYLLITAMQPEGIICLWDEGDMWAEIHSIWLWGMVAYKLGVAMILFVVIWLTLWARQLAKNIELTVMFATN